MQNPRQYSDITASGNSRSHFGDAYTTYVGRPFAGSNNGLDATKALCEAASHGSTDRVKYLLEERGVDIDKLDEFGLTALHHACLGGYHDTAHFLISKGANVNFVSPVQGSPLCVAVLKERINTVKLLLDCRADVNTAGGYLGSALHVACYIGNQDLAELLLSARAQPDLRRMFLWSEARQLRGPDVKGRQINENFSEVSPIDVAVMRGFDELARYLQQPRRPAVPPRPTAPSPTPAYNSSPVYGPNQAHSSNPSLSPNSAYHQTATWPQWQGGFPTASTHSYPPMFQSQQPHTQSSASPPVPNVDDDPIVMAARARNPNTFLIMGLVEKRQKAGTLTDEVLVAAINLLSKHLDQGVLVMYLEQLRAFLLCQSN